MPEADAPLAPYRFVVPTDWCDYNRHFSDGYYLVAFSNASDAVLDAVGLGAAYRARGAFSAYTVEARLRYLREGKAGDELAITQLVRDSDTKRMWVYQEMRRGDELLATCECTHLHVDVRVPKAAPFPPEILELIARFRAANPA